MKLNYSTSLGPYITADALEDLLRDFINTGCPGATDLALECLDEIETALETKSGNVNER